MVAGNSRRGASEERAAVLSSCWPRTAETEYVAYVSEQNLLPDVSGEPLRHPQIEEMFALGEDGSYRPLFLQQPH